MTVKEAITQTDLLKPNQYDEKTKTAWLSVLDGNIWNEVFSYHEEGETPAPYQYPQDAAKTLLVEEPYSDLYVKYLSAQIDYANAEYGRYNNAMTLYNAIYAAFQSYYRLHHLPKQANQLIHYS